jgi:hypothetical protein
MGRRLSEMLAELPNPESVHFHTEEDWLPVKKVTDDDKFPDG